MAIADRRAQPRPLHPLNAILLAFPLPLFLGALLADMAYSSTYEIQWTNFASWLVAFGLFTATFPLLWALASLIRGGRRGRRTVYFLVLLALWVLGLLNALVHAKDGWGAMPMGLYLSAATALLALAAAWIGYSGFAAREVK